MFFQSLNIHLKGSLVHFILLTCFLSPVSVVNGGVKNTAHVPKKLYFQINQHVLAIQKKTLNLQIKEVAQDLHERRLAEPGNKMYDFLESYTWFFTLFIQEEQTQYDRALKRKKTLLENIKKGDPTSPYYRFCQAEILLQWATIHLKFNEKTKAAYDVYEAYQLLEENTKRFPDFHENYKSLSIIHALAQSLPAWVQKLSGIKGSVSQGTKEIEVLVNRIHNYPLFKDEILAIYIYILFYTKQEKELAYTVIQKYKLNESQSPLLIFLTATITQKSGKNNDAIKILEERHKSPGQLPFLYLDFLLGKYKLYRLDKDANQHILKFVNGFKGRHYIKEAYQKLYWYEQLFGSNPGKSGYYKQQILKAGKSLIDEDSQALTESRDGAPNPVLLKSRLLYDGGYYTRSMEELKSVSPDRFTTEEKEEYYYRIAKNSDALLMYEDAIIHYKKALTLSTGVKYYACSSALSLGHLYEKQQNFVLAKQYYQECLVLHPEGYSTSLHQKAKTALARMESKN